MMTAGYNFKHRLKRRMDKVMMVRKVKLKMKRRAESKIKKKLSLTLS